MNPESLELLLEKLCQGDTSAARRLFLAYEPYLRRFVRRQLPPHWRAKFDSLDIVQSAWVDLLNGCAAQNWDFADADRFQAFLVRVTRNRFVTTFRKHRASLEKEEWLGDVHTSELPACREPHGQDLVEAEELWEKMLALCAPEHQELLRLKRQGLPMEELVARTGLHPGSIRRILRTLARKLALQEGPSPPESFA
jgi:RNA polymerase sigma-70 factor (ECF subfamily)